MLFTGYFFLQLPIGILLGALIGYLAWRADALSPSGAWAAALVGGVIFGLGGLPWAVLLLTFFISSSAFSRLFAPRKKTLNEKFSKGSRRDWGQVLANGGLGTLLGLTGAVLPGQPWIWIAYAGAMAAVNADTWATELGVLSRKPPRLVTTGQPVERGTSGAVSLTGTLAALAGAALIAALAALLTSPELKDSAAKIFLVSLVGGATGALFDSLLGATVQAIYYCPACGKETERHPLHLCGTQTIQVRGWRWLDNDLVNFACSLAGAVVSVALWLLVF